MEEILQIQRGHKAVLLTDLQLSPNIMENQQIIWLTWPSSQHIQIWFNVF